MDQITRINGNGKEYTTDLPRIVLQGYYNEVALKHIFENTNLNFVKCSDGYEAQPIKYKQMAVLFLTYNFKSRYFNNACHKNTLFLKTDHHIGYDVDSICFKCCQRNGIHTTNLKEGEFISC